MDALPVWYPKRPYWGRKRGTKRRRGLKGGFLALRFRLRCEERGEIPPPTHSPPPLRSPKEEPAANEGGLSARPLPHRRPVAPLTHPPRWCPCAFFSQGGFRVSTYVRFFFWQNLFFGKDCTMRGWLLLPRRAGILKGPK